MEISMRVFRNFNRSIQNRFKLANVRNITGTAVKEDVNTELLHSYNKDIKKGGVVPVFRRALLFPTRVALQDEVGIYTYAGLHQAATVLSQEISAQLVGETECTVAYMCHNDASHVIAQWAIWMSGNIAVPLTPLHPPDMLKYFISNSESSLVLCTQDYEKILRPIAKEVSRPILVTSRDKQITAQLYQPNSTFMKSKKDDEAYDFGRSNKWYKDADAMIIYTSGTTNKPKGVIWSHAMLDTQIASLHAAWHYSANDVVLHTLPLHHIHGQLNSLNASLAAGARLRMLPSFASHTVWARLLGMGEREESKITVFHGVPSMYAKLANDHEQLFGGVRTEQYVKTTLSRMRLMCAGSAPLPETLAKKWYEISGHRLLERYGMSEVGMALSNPYRPEDARTVGCVGLPLPGISARIAVPESEGSLKMLPSITVETPVPDKSICLETLGVTSGSTQEFFSAEERTGWKPPKVTVHAQSADGVYQGELLLKGPGIFQRYYNVPPAIESKDFTIDGWFRTGDVASYSENRFKILGRTSVDIIKTGGYKVSALQVESAILEIPNVVDAAVLGIEDKTYGEIVSAVIALKANTKISLQELRAETGKKLAPYQLPKTMVVVEQMPRNVMGKLDKKEIRRIYGKDLALKK